MQLKSRQIIARILLVIFALYFANICFFYHSHIINGVTIVHSHIHNSDHAQSGTHSESELTLISTLSSFQTLQAILFFVGLGVTLFLSAIIRPVAEKKTSRDLVACISLRAPPVFS